MAPVSVSRDTRGQSVIKVSETLWRLKIFVFVCCTYNLYDKQAVRSWRGLKYHDGFVGCPFGTWGFSCQERCFCGSHGDCDKETGVCDCDSGYNGTHCSQSKSHCMDKIEFTTSHFPLRRKSFHCQCCLLFYKHTQISKLHFSLSYVFLNTT